MLSLAAGLLPVPLFNVLNAASVEKGFERRPQPDTVQAGALLLMNQTIPLTVIETVAWRFKAALLALGLSVRV